MTVYTEEPRPTLYKSNNVVLVEEKKNLSTNLRTARFLISETKDFFFLLFCIERNLGNSASWMGTAQKRLRIRGY